MVDPHLLAFVQVMYNAKTSKFVLWWNFVTEGWETNNTAFEHQHWSTLATATSDTPQGPYTIAHPPPIPMGTGNQSYAHGVSAAATWWAFVSESLQSSAAGLWCLHGHGRQGLHCL